ncbi:MAG: DNA double-strand break repair nuclease NurA [Solirubrobacteraceae bacterium]
MKLRVDPWDPEYGGSVEMEADMGPPSGLRLDVETDGAWSPVPSPGRGSAVCCAFVDGVRRIDARLFAEEGDVAAPALAGSWAVGAAWSSIPPRVSDVRVGRELVIGGGLSADALQVDIGGRTTAFAPRSVDGLTPLEPIQGLQNAMRAAESVLAQDILSSKAADLLVSDGPITYKATGPAVGLIKRHARSYLGGEHARVLGALDVGERTPIFKFGEQRLERYSWYLRLARPRSIDGTMAGLVRLEVAALDGVDCARKLAELTASALPRFAPTQGRDARAPQNLYPISALEGRLRHRLGDAALVRRALEISIYQEVLRGG